jgi:hypothetical protein
MSAGTKDDVSPPEPGELGDSKAGLDRNEQERAIAAADQVPVFGPARSASISSSPRNSTITPTIAPPDSCQGFRNRSKGSRTTATQ